MKKGDAKNIISAMRKEKKCYHFYDGEFIYLSNSYFILRSTDSDMCQYIIDKVNDKKKAPEWSELESLTKFFENINGEVCTDIRQTIMYDKRTCLCLQYGDDYALINRDYTVPGGVYFVSGKRSPVYEKIDKDNLLMILPINH